jgi:endonuclease YncB( thermonuclease family)
MAGEVHDGDTFTLGESLVRLRGIDTPELEQRGGAAAWERLAAILKGRTLACGRHGTDHGRVVARCTMDDGPGPARQMVRFGHACDWPKFCRGEDATDQKVAQRDHAGRGTATSARRESSGGSSGSLDHPL